MAEDDTKKEFGTLDNSVLIYTEVTPERASNILNGNYEPTQTILDRPKRWYAETVLEFFQPEALKKQGITRNQPLFTTPIPFQGGNPIESKVLVEMNADATTMYVAEATHISEIITPQFSPSNVLKVNRISKALEQSKERVSREHFNEMFNMLPASERLELVKMYEEQAKKYWESVIPFTEYIKRGLAFVEPEILMKVDTKIFSSRLSNVPKPNVY